MTATSARVLGVVTAISAAAVVAGPTAVAVPGGLLLAFALPGTALTGVMFRRRDVSAVERVVLAPALSLATLIVSGLLMNAVGIGLDRAAWVSATAGVTLLALFAGALPARAGDGTAAATTAGGSREPALAAAGAARAAAAGVGAATRGSAAFSPEDTVRLVLVPPVTDPTRPAPTGDPSAAPVAGPTAATPGVDTPAGAGPADAGPADAGPAGAVPAGAGIDGTDSGRGRSLVRQLLPLALAVLVAGGAGWLSYDSSRDGFTQTVTTLSAAPPGAVSPAGTRVVRVTADGLVPADGPYTLDVRGGARRSLDRRAVTPVAGAWTAELILPGRERVTIDLLRAADATPYRTVVIAAAD